MDLYAVVGNPIGHSKSPLIHSMFAEQTGETMVYEKIEAPLDEFNKTVTHFFAQDNGKGLNVTVPFKEQAWELCSSRTERAELAGAVNTLFLDERGQICGDNTDGVGLVADIKQQGIELKGKKILIVGAGGAVRGILQPILKEYPAELCICNRTVSKAEALAQMMTGLGDIAFGSFESFSEAFDIVINGTSASLNGELPPLQGTIITKNTVCYDMMYGAEETIFNQWAKSQGALKVIDGLGMLVGQAAEAFSIWRGVRPQTEQVMTALRSM